MPPRHMLACIAPTWWSMHPTATYAGLQPTAPCCTLWPAHTNAYEQTNPRAGLHMQMDRYKHPRTCWPAPHATQEALSRRLADRTAVNERTMRQHTQEATALNQCLNTHKPLHMLACTTRHAGGAAPAPTPLHMRPTPHRRCCAGAWRTAPW